MSALFALARRDLARNFAGGLWWLPVAFFLLVATLYPFAVGPDAALLARTAGGMLWVAALLAALLPIDRLFAPDIDAGLFDQLALRGIADEAVVAAKLVAHMIGFALPLALASLPAAALLHLSRDGLATYLSGLAAGAPGLAALTVMVSAIAATQRGAGALAGLMMLPLAVPILIFGAGMFDPLARGSLLMLAAASLLLVAIAPFAGGAALRAAREK